MFPTETRGYGVSPLVLKAGISKTLSDPVVYAVSVPYSYCGPEGSCTYFQSPQFDSPVFSKITPRLHEEAGF